MPRPIEIREEARRISNISLFGRQDLEAQEILELVKKAVDDHDHEVFTDLAKILKQSGKTAADPRDLYDRSEMMLHISTYTKEHDISDKKGFYKYLSEVDGVFLCRLIQRKGWTDIQKNLSDYVRNIDKELAPKIKEDKVPEDSDGFTRRMDDKLDRLPSKGD